MKQLLQGILATCCITLLLSCKREVLKSPPPVVDGRIQKIIIKTNRLQDRSGTITYNTHGDPISYTPAGYGSGSVRYEFRYDANRRLTDYIGYYAGQAVQVYEFWTKYYYTNNKVTSDSTYYYGIYGAQLTSHAKHVGFTTYSYDSRGRISGTVYRQFFDGKANGVIADYKYIYNDEGNLVVPGAAYDNRTSIYRTSNIWMFLSRNYSVNNLRRATAYNKKGLPKAFDQAGARAASMRFLEFIDFSDCEIVYEGE